MGHIYDIVSMWLGLTVSSSVITYHSQTSIVRWQWVLMGFWLWFSVMTASAADLGGSPPQVMPQNNNVGTLKSTAAPPAPVPWERIALIGTGIVAGIASLGGQMNPGIMAAAVGGALGSVTRLVISHSVGGWVEQDFPYGTMSVNVIGSFAFGLVSGLVNLRDDTPETAWFTLVTTGFLGGFTTFSTFAYDSVHLQREEGLYSAATYTILSVGISIVAILVGEYTGSSIVGIR